MFREDLAELSEEEILRYQNQTALPGFGTKGQQKLKNASVAVIGTGGLGSPVLFYLVSMGIGKIRIIDFDVVSESNLHRQILHTSDSVGEPKVESASRRLNQLNPNVKIEALNVKLDISNAESLLKDVDVIVDCCDNFETRYLVNQTAVKCGVVLCSGSVYQYMGQIAIFSPKGDSPCYQCLFPTQKKSSMIPENKKVGVWAAMIGVVGCIQADLVLNYLLGREERYKFGELIIYDSENQSIRKLNFKRNKKCCICGEDKNEMCKH